MRRAIVVAAAGLVLPGCGGSSGKPVEGSGDPGGSLIVSARDTTGRPQPPFSETLERDRVSSRGFRLVELPQFQEKGTAAAGAGGKAKETPIPEIRVTRNGSANATVEIVPAAFRASRVTIGEQPSFGDRGLAVQCGVWAASPLRLETLTFASDGSATYTQVSGIFDGSRCEAVGHARVTVKPAVIVPGLLFGLRVCRDAGCGSGQRVTFFMPPLSQMEAESHGGPPGQLHKPFAVVSFDVVRGGAASMTGIVDEGALTALFGGTRPSWLAAGGPIVLGVDLIESTEESEPIGVAFSGVARAVAPPEPEERPLHDPH